MSDPAPRPPRDDLVRAQRGTYQLRAAADDGAMPTLTGHFAVFDEWTEIDSAYEGHFMERIAPGAFTKTFAESPPKVLFQHGHDPSIGDKPLGALQSLSEDDRGAFYEVSLLDTAYVRDLIPGLQADLYGASFRFGVVREDFVRSPERSDHNPNALPERTIREARVPEFGPVTFPAYAGATAGIRSLTDEYVFSKFTDDPRRLSQVIDYVRAEADPLAAVAVTNAATASPIAATVTVPATTGYVQTTGTSTTPSRFLPTTSPNTGDAVTNLRITSAGAQPHPATEGVRSTTPAPRTEAPKMPEQEDLNVQYPTREEKVARITELKADMVRMADENGGVASDADERRWNDSDAEIMSLLDAVAAFDKRMQRIHEIGRQDEAVTGADRGTAPARGQVEPATVNREWQVRPSTMTQAELYDRSTVYRDSKSPEDQAQRFRDRALRAVDSTTFPHERANQADVKGGIEQLLLTSESSDAEIARRILVTGSPAYRRGFGKALKAGGLDTLTHEERTVMAEGAGATGGFAITFDLDPTIVRTSNGAVNPFRAACKVVTISGTNEWRAVSSGAVVATYEAEATEAVDRSPTLAQPAFVTQRAQTFIPFSIELDQDWNALQSEMAGLIQDSKDTLEATQFAIGVGTTVFPQGITVGATATATSGTTTVLAVNDIYKTEEALAPRFRPNAQWFANRFIYNKVRQLDTAGGANLWVPRLSEGLANNPQGNTGYNLIGYPANEASGMAATLATTTKLAVLGDPNFYVIVERVGLDIELIPHLFGATAHYPTGQRGIYAMWRNTGRVLNAAGFVTLVGL